MANLSVSDLAGLRIRQGRQRRDWTAKDLADQCAAAGAPHITPTVITNLETRRRKTREITVDEVLVLAYVLDVHPLELMIPEGASEELEVVPGVHLDALSAADWIGGGTAPGTLGVIGSPAENADDPIARWQERVAHVAGRAILRYRNRRRLSAPQLADRTAELGMPVPRSVLADLESGSRDTVSVAEVLVLAAALGVAPIELICPVGYDEQVELLPGRMMEPMEAAKWIYGDRRLDVSGATTVLRRPESDAEDWSTTELVDEHESVLDDVRDLEAKVIQRALELDVARTAVTMAQAAAADAAERDKDPVTAATMTEEAAKRQQTADTAEAELASMMGIAANYREHAGRTLRHLRAEMRSRGMLLPPLPPSLKDVADEAAAALPQSLRATEPGHVGNADGEG